MMGIIMIIIIMDIASVNYYDLIYKVTIPDEICYMLSLWLWPWRITIPHRTTVYRHKVWRWLAHPVIDHSAFCAWSLWDLATLWLCQLPLALKIALPVTVVMGNLWNNLNFFTTFRSSANEINGQAGNAWLPCMGRGHNRTTLNPKASELVSK